MMVKLMYITMFGFFLACSNGGNSTDGLGALRSETYANDETELMYEEVPVASETTEEVARESKIIKTANLSFESADPEETHKKIISLVTSLKGFISNDNAGKEPVPQRQPPARIHSTPAWRRPPNPIPPPGGHPA